MLKKLYSFFKKEILWIFIAGLIFGLFAYISYSYSRFLINPDGVAYMSIAEQYAEGSLKTAVNGYWSPMLSWLMVPFIYAGLDSQSAFAFVNFFTAVAIILLGVVVVDKVGSRRTSYRLFYVFTMVPFLGYALVSSVVPDLLSVLWMVLAIAATLYVDRYINPLNQSKKYTKAFLLLGLIGALGYYVKLYLLLFFITTLVIYIFYKFWPMYRKTNSKYTYSKIVLKNLLYPLIFTLLFIAPWLTLISLKYEKPLLSASLEVNASIPTENFRGQPQTYKLLPPPHENSITAWEDPTVIDYELVSPLAGITQIKQKIITMVEKIPNVLTSAHGFSPFILPILFLVLYVVGAIKLSVLTKKRLSIIALFYTVYLGGFLIKGFANIRYLWPLLFIALVASILLLHENQKINKSKNIYILLLFFTIPIVTSIVYYPAMLKRFQTLNTTHKAIRDIAHDIRDNNIIPVETKVAGNRFTHITYLAYYADLKSYGTIDRDDSFDEAHVQKTLNAYDIEYFIGRYSGNEIDKIDDDKIVKTYEAPRWYCSYAPDKCHFVVIKTGY